MIRLPGTVPTHARSIVSPAERPQQPILTRKLSSVDGREVPPTRDESGAVNRRRAALYVYPVLALGVLILVRLLRWRLDPLWAFAILPSICFVALVGRIALRTGCYATDGVCTTRGVLNSRERQG